MILITFIEVFYGIFSKFVWGSLKKIGLRDIFFNDATAKLFIIFGILEWWDLPHLHHPLISLRIKLGERKTFYVCPKCGKIHKVVRHGRKKERC